MSGIGRLGRTTVSALLLLTAGPAVALKRILALAAAIWHNHKTRQPTLRSLVAYDH
jgi:hypothetical protein